jgi:hypothetical protein
MKLMKQTILVFLILGLSPISVRGEQAANEEEIAVDIDSLKDDLFEGAESPDEEIKIDFDSLGDAVDEKSDIDESTPVLPVTMPPEIEKNYSLIFAVLGILLPAAALLFPAKRRRQKRGCAKAASPREME